MIKALKGLLTLPEAAKKYGFEAVTLRGYAQRGRLEAVKIGRDWYTSDQAMKKYIGSREIEKIPKRYRKSRKRD